MLSCRITQLRQSSGMSQLQLAEQLHLSPSAVGMYEQGRRTPNIDVLIQMSKLFNVSLDYLLTGTEFAPSGKRGDANTTPTPFPGHNCCCQKLLDIIRENMSPNEHRRT